MSTFDSTKQLLPKILDEIVAGKLQLPDFQRGWIWDDNHVQSLLVSIARSFPVGAVMLLETGGNVRFQTRPVENVLFDGKPPAPERLILDGQQRLTSLTQVLKLTTPVKTRDEKGKRIKRYYYLNIKAALAGEGLDEAFVGVDESRQIKRNFGRDLILDLSSRQLECEQLFFPCNQILDPTGWTQDLFKYAPDQMQTYFEFQTAVLDEFKNYELPVISLKKETTKEAVCLVFEKVNTGGVPLSVFELITATYAADEYNLRDDWFGARDSDVAGRRERLQQENVLNSIEATDFLQTITLLHTLEKRQADIAAGKTGKAIAPVSAKRVAVLSLPLYAYKKWADSVEEGLMLAAKFMRKQCFYTVRDLPYRTQLVPLAAIMTHLGNRWLEPKIYKKLAQWYWCGVFGELYGGSVDTRIANDLEEVLAWIEDDAREPRTVSDASFQPDRLDTLRSRQSAAYKGLNVLVLRQGAQDFFWKATIQELDHENIPLDIHHIFPRKWCKDRGIPARRYDAVANKTPISFKTNRMIGGVAPSVYLQKLQEHEQVGLNAAEMDTLLNTHLIDAAAMRTDDYEQFYAHRKEALLGLIEHAMSKRILREEIA